MGNPKENCPYRKQQLATSAKQFSVLSQRDRQRERERESQNLISCGLCEGLFEASLMDPDPFTASLFKWDPRGVVPAATNRLLEAVAPPQAAAVYSVRPRELGGLEELFQAYGIRYYTAARIAELGFTVNTLVDMKDNELDDMMNSLSQIFRWDLLVGERYGIKAAVRAERRRLDEEESRRRHLLSPDTTTNTLDALSQEGDLYIPFPLINFVQFLYFSIPLFFLEQKNLENK